MMRRQLTPAEMRERSEMCRRERQHLLRYAIWNSRRIREEREREEAAAAAANKSPPKHADADSPKRLPLQPVENTSNPRVVASPGDAKGSSDEDTSSESTDTSSSDADSDDLDGMVDRFAKLDSPVCPSRLMKWSAERSEVEVAASSSSSDDTDTLSEVEVDESSNSSSDCGEGVLAAEVETVISSTIDDVEPLLEAETEQVDSSSRSDGVEILSETDVVDSNHSSDDSDDSWSDCDDSDDGDGCSCCVISAGRTSGHSDRDLSVFFQRVSKRFNAMITSVNQTRI